MNRNDTLTDADFLAALTPLIPKVDTDRQVRELATNSGYPATYRAILDGELARRTV